MNREQILQDLLNISVKHVRRQGHPSMKGGTCAYRGDGGLQCAAAPFITNYSPDMDDKNLNFRALLEKFPGAVLPESEREAEFVRHVLQAAHDTAAGKTNFMKSYHEQLCDRLFWFNEKEKTKIVVPPPVAMGALTY
jgi:hypothetical protein